MLCSFRGFSFLLPAIFVVMTVSVSARSRPYSCLPADIKVSDTVRVVEQTTRSGAVKLKTITVSDTLRSLKGRCSKGKLVDAKKKEIRFYKLQGCWGNPPADYLEIQERQQRELADLRRKYTVIEMSCNTGLTQQIQ